MGDTTRKQFDVLVVGAGPAGLAAAGTAADSGLKIGLLDDNTAPGGQIWRADLSRAAFPGLKWAAKLCTANVEILCCTQAISHDPASHTLFAEDHHGIFEISFSKLILATGARERFLPFPGWTLPNVMGAGGLQAMVKSGLPIAEKRIIVAGSGPLLLAVAAYLRKQGANVLAICEQASWHALAGFALALFRDRAKMGQALSLYGGLRGIPFWPNTWPLRALGSNQLAAVVIARSGKTHEIACDYLACGFHLVPNTELASLFGCHIENGCVTVDDLQQTSVDDVLCAGEATGIGGLELSLIEGQIAGLAATGRAAQTSELRQQRQRSQSFVKKLEQTFALRPELCRLPDPDTIVCRCEDVTHARASRYTSWRDAKNQTRCGMGPCQGRVCGPATQFLYGWRPESVRPPIFPVKVQSLAAAKVNGELQ